jgi:hypothetical protein
VAPRAAWQVVRIRPRKRFYNHRETVSHQLHAEGRAEMSRYTKARRLVAVAALLVTIAACDSGVDRTVTAPTAPPTPSPPTPPQEGVIAGTALEFTTTGERRPVPNLRLRVRAGSSADGAVGGAELPDVVTDTNGRYEIAGVTSGLLFLSTAPGSSHRFLCDFYPLITRLPPGLPTSLMRDLPVVSVSWSGDRLPPGMWSPGTSVHGTVSERVDGTVRPVAGAAVTLDSGNQDPPATTTASGFYMICSEVGTDQYRTITARKEGYRNTTRQIFGGWDFRIDLELARD